MHIEAFNPGAALGAILNLNHPGRYVHWHFFEMSAANLVVIGLLLLAFVLAIGLPFPGSRRRGSDA